MSENIGKSCGFFKLAFDFAVKKSDESSVVIYSHFKRETANLYYHM